MGLSSIDLAVLPSTLPTEQRPDVGFREVNVTLPQDEGAVVSEELGEAQTVCLERDLGRVAEAAAQRPEEQRVRALARRQDLVELFPYGV